MALRRARHRRDLPGRCSRDCRPPSGPWAASPKWCAATIPRPPLTRCARSGGRALNDNYAALLDHYGLRSTRINRGQSHENGVAEQGHYRLKDAIDQALMLRGSRDFDTVDHNADFVRQMVARRNRLVKGKLEQEMACLRALPPAPMPEYANHQARVRKWSTVQVAGRTYTVPSRLIGKEVQIPAVRRLGGSLLQG